MELIWPSLSSHWKQAVYALPHVLGKYTRPPKAEPQNASPPDSGGDRERWYSKRKPIRVEVFVPSPGRKPVKVAIGLVDPRGPGEGLVELREWLGEVFATLTVPCSGTLEIRLATVDGNLKLVRWRRRIAVGQPPPPPKSKPAGGLVLPDNAELRVPVEGVTVPLLVHVPHSAVAIPPHLRRSIVPSDEELADELLAMTDHYTDVLFRSVRRLGGGMFVNRLSRLVVDPERFPSDEQEPMAKKGMGAVYTLTSTGAPLRRDSFGTAARAKLMRSLHAPYAKAFEKVVTKLLEQFGSCTIVDAHSFPSVRLPYEGRGLARPEICLGHEPFHAGEDLPALLECLLVEHGLEVRHNEPFAGSYVPLRYYKRDKRVRSIMVEVRRDLYMDEETGERLTGLGWVSTLMGELLEAVAKAEMSRQEPGPEKCEEPVEPEVGTAAVAALMQGWSEEIAKVEASLRGRSGQAQEDRND